MSESKPQKISDAQITALRIEAMQLLDEIKERLESLAMQMTALPDTAFWSPDSVVTPRDRVIGGIIDISYDDEQKPTESKQHLGACAVGADVLAIADEVNDAKKRFAKLWGKIAKIRVAAEGQYDRYLAEVLLSGTRFSRVNTYQAKRLLHTVKDHQPTRLGFTLYDSPNPKRISKDSAINRLIGSLPEEYHQHAISAFNHIGEDEDICLLRENTPKARVNVAQYVDGEPVRFQAPAVLPILYLDEGENTVISFKGPRLNRVQSPPRKRESKPIYPGVEMYRYLPDYRYAPQEPVQAE